jgi:NADPH-dependent 2,4-dienoyl-CoA reductase/sulfur reductase-like enzyme
VADRLSFTFDGRPIEAQEGDTYGAALHRAGVLTLTRSRKFHRPRGLSGAYVAGHLARVDGRPNVRLDAERVRDGAEVRAQNVWPRIDIDLLALARLIPRRALRAGFEHTRLIPSGTVLFEPWEAFLRFMAGGAERPSEDARAESMLARRMAVDVAVVGGGPNGRKAATDAASDGASVVLLSRSHDPGAFAHAMGAELPVLAASVTVLAHHEVFALYRQGMLLIAAPRDSGPAVAITPKRIVLATGRRSCPPLVPGADLPGVLDLATALELAHDHGVMPGRRVACVGTEGVERAAERLRALGVNVVLVTPASAVERIVGHNRVTGIVAEGWHNACDCVIHAGPWRPDPSLGFQAGAGGSLRLVPGDLPRHVAIAGETDAEPIVTGRALDDAAFVCPCMDVTVAEARALVEAGERHVEVIKRLTGCGMGTCQGFPCWDNLAAVLTAILGETVVAPDRPTFRPPRGALTLAQAAGLADAVELEP